MVLLVRAAEPKLDESPVASIRFVTPIPGFLEARTAELTPLAEDDPTFLVMSFAESAVEFLTTRPEMFFRDYTPEIDDDTADKIGLTDPDDALLLVIVNGTGGAANATANLFAPVIVNTRNGAAIQAVLYDSGYDLHARLVDGTTSCSS